MIHFKFPQIIDESKRLPNLDGFRCISIIFVLLSHSQQVPGFPTQYRSLASWLPDGGFGVQVFFVISGFLITLLLMKEYLKNDRVSLKRFYIRRGLRIVPAYSAFLAILAILQILRHVQIPPHSWLALGTYLVNYIETPWIAAHVWSLSVEEQFYLLWPFSFCWALARQRSRKLLFCLALLPIVVAPVCRTIGYVAKYPFPFSGHSFFNHADSLAMGCLLALSLGTYAVAIENLMRRFPWWVFLASLICIGAPIIATRLFILGPLTVPFGSTLSATGIVLLLALSFFYGSTPAFAWLNTWPVAIVGTWSYSIYLWQQIFCTPIKGLGLQIAPWWLTFPAWLLPVFLMAMTSYYLVERPFLRMKSRFGV